MGRLAVRLAGCLPAFALLTLGPPAASLALAANFGPASSQVQPNSIRNPADSPKIVPAADVIAPASPAAPSTTIDGGFLSGNELLARCTESSVSAGVFCFGYLSATSDTIHAYERWLHLREFCPPPGTTLSTLRDAFVAEARARPATLGGQAASVVLNAWKRRFACLPG